MATNDGTVNIHGKTYTTVAKRIKDFREKHPDLTLETVVLHRDEDCVVMKALIMSPEGRVIATGHSEEYRDASTINKTSALENCETSAIGRALAAFGLGGTEFASADEVAHAISGKAQARKGHSPSDGSLEALSKEDREFALSMAAEIVDKWNNDKCFAAYELFYESNLSNEIKLGVWEALRPNSSVRSGLKKMRNEETKEPANA